MSITSTGSDDEWWAALAIALTMGTKTVLGLYYDMFKFHNEIKKTKQVTALRCVPVMGVDRASEQCHGRVQDDPHSTALVTYTKKRCHC